jgi:fructose-1,6-bisphosphatase
MSFGFGISDFIKLSEIAVAVVEKYRSAPSEYQTLQHEVEALQHALDSIVQALKRLRNPEYTCKMKTTRVECEELLRDLERFLDQHKALSGAVNAGDRLRWIASERKEYIKKVKQQNKDLHKVVNQVML